MKRLIFSIIIFGLAWTAAGTELRFAQLTDPHLFDSGREQLENEKVLEWCIAQINDKVAKGQNYMFVAVTGDLGLEKLPYQGTNVSDKTPAGMREAAERLGKLISRSKVATWLFLPGNNDLVGEDPSTITNYEAFIQSLSREAYGITVKNLCPRRDDPRSGQFSAQSGSNTFVFVGFDNASFKGNNSEQDAIRFETAQLARIADLNQVLASNRASDYSYVLYHIPEVEDPYYASLPSDDLDLREREAARGTIGKALPLFAWTVTTNVWEQWRNIATNGHVRGLFAGHFHSSNRSVYEGFGWLHDPSKSSASLGKLFIAPPIAIKNQSKVPQTARGYREVAINGDTGWIETTEIVWYPGTIGQTSAKNVTDQIWEWLPNLSVLALGILFIIVSLSVKRLSAPGNTIGSWLLRTARTTGIVVGLLLCVLAFKPKGAAAVASHHALTQWELWLNFVIIPCGICALFGALIWGWRKAVRPSQIESSTINTTMLIATLTFGSILVGLSVLASLAYCDEKDACRVVCVGALWGLAALASGSALGFLFGLPRGGAGTVIRSTESGNGKVAIETDATRTKTNLEEIADWLSKLIVGGTLFESGNIVRWLKAAGVHFGQTVTGSATTSSILWSGVGSAILVYFGLVGLFGGFFPTRLFLTQAIRKADEGDKPMVGERTGLPETKLNALEAAPLNVEGAETEFDPIAQEAAKEIVQIPLEVLTNWRDIRLWAKAKLSLADMDDAIKAFQKAIEIVPHDAETRLGYAVALAAKKSSIRLILSQLEAARDSLMRTSPEELRKNIYKSLVYQCLYLNKPESFLKALRHAREYFSTSSEPVESGGLWINIACAYGQAYSWLKSDEQFEVDPTLLVVKSDQTKNLPPGRRPVEWLAAQALAAIRVAISRDPKWKKLVRELMGVDPRSPGRERDNDLEPFRDSADYRKLVES